MNTNQMPAQYTIDNSPTGDEIGWVSKQLHAFNLARTDGEYDLPGIEINLAVKDEAHKVLGGVIASTMLNVMHLEVLWVAEEYRRRGFGKRLVLEAEKVGFQKGCRASSTWTFDFQGPAFYPEAGYELIGVYDGYPKGLQEYVFTKKLGPQSAAEIDDGLEAGGFYVTGDVTKNEIEIMHQGLRRHVDLYVGDEKNGIAIKLVVRDASRNIVGGLHAWTTIHNLLIEYVWVEESIRGMGVGTTLLAEAESIARKNNCIASLACPLSYQSPGFFQNNGYQVFGYSDGYPNQVRENFMIKKFA